MGTLTFDELKDEVRAGLGDRTDLDARLGRFLNLAQQRLARVHDFDEMEAISSTVINNTGSADDRYITLPSLREVYSIIIEDASRSRKLKQRSPRQWDLLLPLPQYHSRDTPSLYTVWNNTIEIFQLPDKSYTMRMRWTKWPTPLSTSNQTSDFLEKDEILVEMSLAYAYRSLGKPDEATKHEGVVRRLLIEAESADRSKPDLDQVGDARPGVQGPSDYWRDPFVRSIDE